MALNRLNPNHISDQAGPGSLVVTNYGNFYIAISAGLLKVDNDSYFAISPASPIGLALKGQKAGKEFMLNGKLYQIKMVI